MDTNDKRTAKKQVPKKKTRAKNSKKKSVRRKRSNRLRRIIPIIVVIIILFLIINKFLSYYDTDMSTGTEENIVDINIPDGSTVNEIAKYLDDNGVIDSSLHFRILCKKYGVGSEFKSGYYTFTNHMDFEEIVKLLNNGSTGENAIRLTVTEGMWLTEVADAVAATGICSRDDFMEAANSRDYDYDFIKDIPDRDNLLEGYLYPNTYFLYDGMTAKDIVNMLLGEFSKQIEKNDIISLAAKKNKTLDEIITIASLIEAEVKYEPERTLVSSVIYNRLEQGTKLQIDASVIYAMGERVTRVYEKDLKIESDYNTYYVDGLPKGPINSPRIASIIAACKPDNTKYIYYVVQDMETGQHKFCETYDEFLEAKEKYLSKVN